MSSLFDFQSHLVKQFLWRQLGDFMETDYRPFLIKKLLGFQEEQLSMQEELLVEELDKSFPIITQLKARQSLDKILEVLPLASIFVTIQFSQNMDCLYVGLAIKPLTAANEQAQSNNLEYYFDIRKFDMSLEARKVLQEFSDLEKEISGSFAKTPLLTPEDIDNLESDWDKIYSERYAIF
jgi:hypothetical protein